MKKLGDGWDGSMLLDVWNRDDPFTTADMPRAFLNRQTGELRWGKQRGNRRSWDPAGDPAWEEIPALDHGDHHKIFNAWLDTLPMERVGWSVNPASIGHTLKMLDANYPDDDYRSAWHEFHEESLTAYGITWLAERGFSVGLRIEGDE
jgi:hypothetical protein